MEKERMVMIIGAGPAGIAVSACLNRLDISNIVLEREDCCASLWKKRSYDRLKLHLAKQYCELPYMPIPRESPTFVPRNDFISYLNNYVGFFNVKPRYNRCVECAYYDVGIGKWCVMVKNILLNVREVYVAKFLVIASGENSEGFIPRVNGMDSFGGKFMHSSCYENGEKFKGKNVLVVGCGNSGMEIAYDLSNWDAKTSIVARNTVHVLTKEMVYVGMFLLKIFPCNIVDKFTTMLSKLKYGNFSKYGLQRPEKGPFYLKGTTGRSPTIDVGTMEKIESGEIKVFPSITSIIGDVVNFKNDTEKKFDAIIFATGYRSTVRNWFMGGEDLFNENGMPKKVFPNHWKGEKGLYCAGFSGKGLFGISNDAQNIARDISLILK